MTDERVETLAKAMYEAAFPGYGLEPSCKDHWMNLANVALAHIGERRGISFEGMDDKLLMHLRDEFVAYQDFDRAMACRNEMERRKELARRAAAAPEPDEWREAIEGVLEHFGVTHVPTKTDHILAAIEPLREKLNYTCAEDWRAEAYRQEKRACEAEAELQRLRDVIRSWAKGTHGCAADNTTQ